MEKLLFVVNPTAGNGRAQKIWARLERQLQETGERYQVIMSTRPGEIPELVRQAIEQQPPERIVAVGGDGTISEVVNGFAPQPIPLGVIPAGSGNDFAANLGIPRHPEAALKRALTGEPRAIDLATINDRYFINIGGVGFDAVVAAETNRIGKKLRGPLPYIVALLKTLFTYRNTPVTIKIDGKELEARVLLIAVGNGRRFAGGLRILPTADAADGLLDVCIVGDLNKMETLAQLPRLFNGTHVNHPKVTMCRGRRVTITAQRPINSQADGEPLGVTPVTFEVLPGQLLVLI